MCVVVALEVADDVAWVVVVVVVVVVAVVAEVVVVVVDAAALTVLVDSACVELVERIVEAGEGSMRRLSREQTIPEQYGTELTED